MKCYLDVLQPPFRGKCCCICSHRVKITSHPWVNGFSTDHQTGWGCILPNLRDEDGDRVVILSKGHGMCELFRHKRSRNGN